MFDWDGGNAEKIRDLHDVEPDEVEEALTDPDRISETVYNTATEKRRGILGMTETSRLLFVVYTNRGGRIRVVTAYGASRRQCARYLKRKR
ncbi:MAG: BrnT family toxin [Dehalococcoidia bacterium]